MDNLVERNIAIIPARGGSKRIPKKNILELNGRPMIAYTIRAALDTGLFSKVLVSTDDEEIASVSREYGADVPFLRDKYADDHSPISEATAHVLEKLKERGEKYNNVVQLMANCPLRGAREIIDAFNYFQEGGHDFQLSCFKYGWMNPWWAHSIDENGVAKPVFDNEIRNKRSQDQPVLYCPTGAIWIAKASKLLETRTFYGSGYRFFSMPWQKALDVDDYEDLAMVKMVQHGE